MSRSEDEREVGPEVIIRIGISSCLLGQKVRYDGGHKRDRFATACGVIRRSGACDITFSLVEA